MERKVTSKMAAWKSNPDHKPLLLTGCRQIGKTYSVQEFGRKNYDDVVYMNFEEEPDRKLIFSGNIDHRTILERIEIIEKKTLRNGKTLLILDEIQSCDAAYSSLKHLSEQKDVDVIALGSFLGIRIDSGERLSPLGYVDLLAMHPMDFEEFLWAMGYDRRMIESVANSIMSIKAIDPVINIALSDAFRRYIAVGGMPEAVATYASTGSYMKAYEKLKDIIEILKRDAGKYSDAADRMKIVKCLESVPSQLAKGGKKFIYAEIEKRRGRGARYYGSALDWLKNAGLIEYCFNVSEPNPPLSAKTIADDFKIYLCDTGLMSVLIEDADIDALVNRDPYANNGAFLENAVACVLTKKDTPSVSTGRKEARWRSTSWLTSQEPLGCWRSNQAGARDPNRSTRSLRKKTGSAQASSWPKGTSRSTATARSISPCTAHASWMKAPWPR